QSIQIFFCTTPKIVAKTLAFKANITSCYLFCQDNSQALCHSFTYYLIQLPKLQIGNAPVPETLVSTSF
ncbi:MAG: hypothetical protein AAB318_04985, partial [Planctomycetota bacterium]